MNTATFTSLLHHPENVSEAELNDLEKITKAYPWFQAARALQLKALKLRDSIAYNTALKHTAAYTADRAVLFDFITSGSFVQHQTAETISRNTADLRSIKVTSETPVVEPIDREATEAVLDPELFQPLNRETEPVETTPEEQLQLGKPLEFDPGELHSFSTWLKLSLPNPVNRSAPADNTPQKKQEQKEKFRRIDAFIAQNPKIIPRKENVSSPNLTEGVTVEKTGLMTETLARVYLEQKKFKKAIRAYKILSLKYPEKSGFFADQIKAIKKLQQK